MLTFFAIVIDGLIFCSWLFLVSLGLTLIFGVMKMLNFAHGALFALGAYTGAWMIGAYFAHGFAPMGSFAVILVAAIVSAVISGLIIEKGILKYMYGKDEVVLLLATYGIFLVIQDMIKLIFGVSPYFPYQPYSLLGTLEISELYYANYSFLLLAFAVFIGLLVWWVLNRTRLGKTLLAVIYDREMSISMGINVQSIFTGTFVAGTLLAALAGAVIAPSISVHLDIGPEIVVLAFAVVVIGGLGSIGGAAVGSLIVGIARAGAVHLWPEIELFIIYAVMCLVLMFRPQGLFVAVEARKI